MSDDWQVGDQAIFVGNKADCITCMGNFGQVDSVGVNTVVSIRRNFEGDLIGTCGLSFGGAHFCSCGFRKPDQHEPCEAEFVTLLKRSRKKVSA